MWVAQRELMYARYTRVAMHIVAYDMQVAMHIVACATKNSEKIYKSGLKIMHQRSCTSIVFWPLQSKLSFFVPTW